RQPGGSEAHPAGAGRKHVQLLWFEIRRKFGERKSRRDGSELARSVYSQYRQSTEYRRKRRSRATETIAFEFGDPVRSSFGVDISRTLGRSIDAERPKRDEKRVQVRR